MTAQNCKECHQPFIPEPDDTAQSEYCEQCFLDYNLAFVQIHEYIQENPKPRGYKLSDIGSIVQEASVDKKYVQKYFQDSELKKCILDFGEQACERCNEALEPGQKKYCKPCTSQLANVFEPYANNVSPLTGKRGNGFRRRGSREGGSRFGKH